MPLVADDVDSPEDFADIAQQVADGIYECLTVELIPEDVTPGEKIPVVKNRRIVERLGDAYAARLQSNRHLVGVDENQVQKVHAFMVGYGGIQKNDDSTVGRAGFTLRFLIDSYYEDDIGTDEDNAERRHAAEVHRVAYLLFASKVLRRPGIVQQVIGFSERRGFARMGEKQVRESLAEVFVKLKAVPLVKPSA